MTQIPAGWYPDPDPDAPEPKGQRYWDGQQWTEHVQPAPQPAQGSAPPPYPSGQPGQPGQEQVGYPGYQGYPAQPTYAAPGKVTTPDGQEVSGWGRRAVAYLIDSVIINLVSWTVAFPAARDYFDAVNEMTDEIISGDVAQGPTFGITAEMAQPLLVIGLVSLVVSLVYNVAFLRTKAATPGKLALGLRVRLRETPGQMSYGTILARWFGQNLNSFIGYLPTLGFLGGIYWLLNYLWPLWDSKNQALHDKIAKTNVVRVR
jgi:uncharacterized RDD family membrane protein YckC